ncbi:hypothetical protein GJ496_005436 [Pomphorhynchus laevis]|nr:hypothetical protein GJ496_005436 [Pomphorhynchus laevis]
MTSTMYRVEPYLDYDFIRQFSNFYNGMYRLPSCVNKIDQDNICESQSKQVADNLCQWPDKIVIQLDSSNIDDSIIIYNIIQQFQNTGKPLNVSVHYHCKISSQKKSRIKSYKIENSQHPEALNICIVWMITKLGLPTAFVYSPDFTIPILGSQQICELIKRISIHDDSPYDIFKK